jgi:hypothetical protein
MSRLRGSLCKAQKHIRAAELKTESKEDSSVQQPPTDIECDAPTAIDTRLPANIVINVNPTDQKNWTLVGRVQSAICKASQLDITGPQDLAADSLAG